MKNKSGNDSNKINQKVTNYGTGRDRKYEESSAKKILKEQQNQSLNNSLSPEMTQALLSLLFGSVISNVKEGKIEGKKDQVEKANNGFKGVGDYYSNVSDKEKRELFGVVKKSFVEIASMEDFEKKNFLDLFAQLQGAIVNNITQKKPLNEEVALAFCATLLFEFVQSEKENGQSNLSVQGDGAKTKKIKNLFGKIDNLFSQIDANSIENNNFYDSASKIVINEVGNRYVELLSDKSSKVKLNDGSMFANLLKYAGFDDLTPPSLNSELDILNREIYYKSFDYIANIAISDIVGNAINESGLDNFEDNKVEDLKDVINRKVKGAFACFNGKNNKELLDLNKHYLKNANSFVDERLSLCSFLYKEISNQYSKSELSEEDLPKILQDILDKSYKKYPAREGNEQEYRLGFIGNVLEKIKENEKDKESLEEKLSTQENATRLNQSPIDKFKAALTTIVILNHASAAGAVYAQGGDGTNVDVSSVYYNNQTKSIEYQPYQFNGAPIKFLRGDKGLGLDISFRNSSGVDVRQTLFDSSNLGDPADIASMNIASAFLLNSNSVFVAFNCRRAKFNLEGSNYAQRSGTDFTRSTDIDVCGITVDLNKLNIGDTKRYLTSQISIPLNFNPNVLDSDYNLIGDKGDQLVDETTKTGFRIYPGYSQINSGSINPSCFILTYLDKVDNSYHSINIGLKNGSVALRTSPDPECKYTTTPEITPTQVVSKTSTDSTTQSVTATASPTFIKVPRSVPVPVPFPAPVPVEANNIPTPVPVTSSPAPVIGSIQIPVVVSSPITSTIAPAPYNQTIMPAPSPYNNATNVTRAAAIAGVESGGSDKALIIGAVAGVVGLCCLAIVGCCIYAKCCRNTKHLVMNAGAGYLESAPGSDPSSASASKLQTQSELGIV